MPQRTRRDAQQSAPSQPPPSNGDVDIADGGAARVGDSDAAERPQLRGDAGAAHIARSGGGDPGHSLQPPESLASGSAIRV